MAIGEALCFNQLDEKKCRKYSTKLDSILQDLLSEFADTSLDCGAFHSYVKSHAFKQHIQPFFCTIYSSEIHTQSYKQCLIECIRDTVPGLNVSELHSFLDKLIILYESHLSLTIKNDPTVDALFRLLIKANHDATNKVIENQEEILKYIKTQVANNVVIDEDILAYHSICENEFSVIRFTGISGGAERRQDLNINDFYIKSTLSYNLPNDHREYSSQADKLPIIPIEKIFDISNKIVILGGAGLGKTTTLNYIYCNYEHLFQPCKLKIKIDLKQYVREICESNKDVLSCISIDFYKKVKRKNTTLEMISVLLADLLTEGSCVIIFDALDEIASQAARNKVRDEIANFTAIYYLNRYIISSRETGYLRNHFDDSFLHLRINEFGDQQIRKYSENWFKNNNGSDFEDFWKRFIAEVARARCENLIGNPIILILALIIFNIENNLPNKRIEFYEKCIETFLSVREDRKAAYPLSDKAKNILGSDCVIPQIAYYKFSHTKVDLDYKFSIKELNSAIFEAISVPDKINWNAAVNEFSQYIIERTELIQEVDENELDFAHKTFFEYFLAVYYVKELDDERLIDLLNEWIGDSNYDELAQLIIEVIIKNNNSRQHRKVIDYLFSSVENRTDDTEEFAVNALLILSGLYSHSMLLPKFHKRYHLCILHNAFLVRDANMLRMMGSRKREKISYDSDFLAQLFSETVSEQGDMSGVIDALYVLNIPFQNSVVQKMNDSQFEQLVSLFRYSSRQYKVNSNAMHVFNYFTCDEGFSLLLQYPQIYLSVINILSYLDNREKLVKLAMPKYSANCLFLCYVNPSTFSYLIHLASVSREGLVILLSSIIDCASGKTNFLFCYFARHYSQGNIKQYGDTIPFLCQLWNALAFSTSYRDFSVFLSNYNLHDPKYDCQLERLFISYQENEKDREYHRTQSLLNCISEEYLNHKETAT